MVAKHEARYDRQVALQQIGAVGQARLAAATVIIVGCGGLGSVSAELLVRAGVGYLRLVDDDRVELANLVGQTLYGEEDARTGQFKVLAAARRLSRLNPCVTIEPVVARINGRNAGKLIAGADLVLDGTDNDATRCLINRVCLKQGIPWIFAAILECYGLTMNIVPGETPCFGCLFGRPGPRRSRDHKGSLSTATHVVASLQVSQALRLLLRDGRYSRGLVYVDVWTPELERLDVKSPPQGCLACGRQSLERQAPTLFAAAPAVAA
jgi:adenylyltransferase/sulfurtransferase